MISKKPGCPIADIHGEDQVLNRYTREGVFEADNGKVYWVFDRHAILLSAPFTAATLVELSIAPIATGTSLGFTQFHWWEAVSELEFADGVGPCNCTHQVVIKFTAGIAELCQHYVRWSPACFWCPAPHQVCHWQLNGCDTEVLFDFDGSCQLGYPEPDEEWHVGAPVCIRTCQDLLTHPPRGSWKSAKRRKGRLLKS